MSESSTNQNIHTEYIDYQEGETRLRGFLAYDESVQSERPAVIIAHDWMGEGPYVEMRAKQLAELGYIAFAADIYGAGVRPQPSEAMQVATSYYQDRPLTRARVNAALDLVRKHTNVDASRIAAIGYCFGGMVVLELARSGADICGVIVFHGGLATPTLADAKNIKAKVLALQGGDDPHVPMEQTQAWIEEMQAGGVDWQLVLYGGAVHAYTNPDAGSDKSKGSAYNEPADRRSWRAMQDFLDEIFNSG